MFQTQYFSGLKDTYLSYFIRKQIMQHRGPVLLLAENTASKMQLLAEIQFFLGQTFPIQDFPDTETLAYDRLSPPQTLIAERLATLALLPQLKNGLIATTFTTLLKRLPPFSFVAQQVLKLAVHDRIAVPQLLDTWLKAGYLRVEQVMTPGEFALRGSIIDIFPASAKTPYRLDLFADTLDSIRSFDPESQRTLDKLDAIDIFPTRDFPLNPSTIQLFQRQISRILGEGSLKTNLVKTISREQVIPGIEYYLPLFFEETASLLDYLPPETLIITVTDGVNVLEQAWHHIQERYELYCHDLDHPVLPPKEVFLLPSTLLHDIKAYQRIILNQTHPHAELFSPPTLPDLRCDPKANAFTKLQTFLSTAPKALLCAENAGRAQLLSEQTRKLNLTMPLFQDWQSFVTSTKPLGIMITPFMASAYLQDLNLQLITENAIFKEHIPVPYAARREETKAGLRSVLELEIGDYVTHLEHGVGRYEGLTQLEMNGGLQEFVTLGYQNEDKLYVPIRELHLLSRYGDKHLERVQLSDLNSDRWQKAKARTAKKMIDIAAELLALYALRKSQQGFACSPPDTDYAIFVERFPYEETPDQLKASADIIADLTSGHPMDRLLCGDVGFGKTEVAMRAAFLAVHSGYQVAILVPTTLLCEQHFDTFSNRFADFPIKIAQLSRFEATQQISEVQRGLEAGTIDIVIGTHKLLNAEIKFHHLGLIIIDEEHRFGVKHKESLKRLKANVHVLTMTATPIPRTLNLAFNALRDLSLIATAPQKRLPIKTIVREYQKTLVQEAILREVYRGGQVYYLSNEVSRMDHKFAELQTLLPEVRFAISHGQLSAKALEQVMTDFYHNRIQVLLTSTIIETGLDVPNANTIIIERADKLGLAQLHQLRGRVGRSHHQAYAYLLTPPWKSLTPDSQKRLEAIQATTELGAGFSLASYDLEIRGAGELLGAEQSGNMQDLGLSLYLDTLDRAVKALQRGERLVPETLYQRDYAKVELNISSLIPDSYIPDPMVRLKFYRSLSEAEQDTQLTALKLELADRFGLLPPPVEYLLETHRLRLLCQHLKLKKLELSASGGRLEFGSVTAINPARLIELIQRNPTVYQLRGSEVLLIKKPLITAEERLTCAHDLLKVLCAPAG